MPTPPSTGENNGTMPRARPSTNIVNWVANVVRECCIEKLRPPRSSAVVASVVLEGATRDADSHPPLRAIVHPCPIAKLAVQRECSPMAPSLAQGHSTPQRPNLVEGPGILLEVNFGLLR